MAKTSDAQVASQRESLDTLPAFVQEFAMLCEDASAKGWHEANGGNLSYRLAPEDIAAFEPRFEDAQSWQLSALALPSLAGEFFLISASGAYLKNAGSRTSGVAGIVQIDETGERYRIRWGFDDGRPSSELLTHLAAYAEGAESADGADRVVYHAHPTHIIALSSVLPADSRRWTRTLWQCLTESIVVFPQGIAAIEWMVPGSPELAEKTRELMRDFKVCVWSHHGIIVRARSLDEVFGMVDTVEKAAEVYLAARSACGGDEPVYLVNDDQLRAVCARYGLTPNKEFLDSATIKIS